MRVFAVFLLAVLATIGYTEGFSPSFQRVTSSSQLYLSTAAPEATKVSQSDIRKQISGLSADNFDSTLKEIEPFLVNEAGATFYAKSMRRIATKAKALSKSLPADYAKEAKATQKRREKQKAFIEAKIAEAASAAESEEADEAAEAEEAPAE
mmetsp:Transcript_3334/g.6261  ORF Transcript_3334/g.6261 Transcript_3334/m.6261 type:complete len:152 (+) Transcript_3334:99-554(+)